MSISPSALSVSEGNIGATSVTLSLTANGNGSGTVQYTTQALSATPGAACTSGVDFISQSGTIVVPEPPPPNVPPIPPSITVLVCADSVVEVDEQFQVVLQNPTAGGSGVNINPPGLSLVTIVNDDAANTAPTANAVSASTNEDTPMATTLSGSDAQQCELTFSIVSGPSNGSLGSISNNTCAAGTDTASVTYTPNPNFSGSDSFTYMVNDGTLDSNVATVSITVNPVNDPPVAVDDAYTTNEDTNLVLDATTVGANDSPVDNDTDVEGDTLTVTAVGGATGGSVSLVAGTITFNPAPNVCEPGNYGFDYTVSDGNGGTDTGHVT